MVCHVGYNGNKGTVSVFDNNKITTFQVSMVDSYNANFKIESVFEKLLVELKGQKLGCFCACLDSCKNDVRKKLIECGLKNGFESVAIIDPKTSLYFLLTLQTKYKLKNGDVFWILFDKWCYIWKKENGCAKRIHRFDTITQEKNYNEIFSKAKWEPNAIFVESNTSGYASQKMKKTYPSCFFDSFSFKNYEYAAMIKARIMANDPEVIEWNAQPVLTWDMIIEEAGEAMLKIEECHPLPVTKTFKVKNINDPIFITHGYMNIIKDEITNPGKGYCSLNIDENEIYSLTLQTTIDKKLIGLDEPPRTYKFPSKIQTNDDQIEAVGIDLGTSRCCAAVNRRNGIETVALESSGGRLLPSFVAYDEERNKCGQIVVSRLRHNYKATVFDVKRFIGKHMDEVVIDSIWPFSVTTLNNQIAIQVIKNNKESTVEPEEVSATLLKHIKEKCEEFQGKPLSKAVITIPAVFTETQKDATVTAAKLAGWITIELLPEPIAASFAYFIDRPIPNQLKILLIDLGGGTLDVCISKIENDEIHIITQNGDSQLGGRDFDQLLINYFKSVLVSNYGISMSKNKYRLMLECQSLKETLSDFPTASLHIDDFDPTKNGIIEISREKFEIMSQILLEKIRNTILTALFRANVQSSQINKVLQVGGGSRMPLVKNLLREMFPNSEHCCETNPDEVVAVGAAYYAYTFFAS